MSDFVDRLSLKYLDTETQEEETLITVTTVEINADPSGTRGVFVLHSQVL